MIAEINDNLYAESLDAKTDRRYAQFACPTNIVLSRNEKRIANLNSLAWRFRIHPFPEKNINHFLRNMESFPPHPALRATFPSRGRHLDDVAGKVSLPPVGKVDSAKNACIVSSKTDEVVPCLPRGLPLWGRCPRRGRMRSPYIAFSCVHRHGWALFLFSRKVSLQENGRRFIFWKRAYAKSPRA